ncbi:unnamed protein product [Gongylonema pulchrum]|uniref:Secreted protein n=1 Tax=Gongylonema pulchrum TaxID=637853 RepID=A0A183EFA9_9BILA|nr:unnamed protein product [Gongylonema pulchrum]
MFNFAEFAKKSCLLIAAVYNVEIILTGILRQKLENSSLYRVTPNRPPLQPSPAQSIHSAFGSNDCHDKLQPPLYVLKFSSLSQKHVIMPIV